MFPTSIPDLYQRFLESQRVVSIDSRRISPGCLFFALKGERFDGNAYAAEALRQGASWAVIDDPAVAGEHERFLWVDDALGSLQQLATHHRRQFDIPLLAITGSNGKTTTKELIAAVLFSQYRLHFTQGNLNNHIGVPLTLLAMPPETEVAVIEMGANHQGEIDLLCRIALPTHGIITNIGKAHLEGFGGIEGVKKGKSELYRFLAAHGGVAFINQDEPFLGELAAPVGKKVFYREAAEGEGDFDRGYGIRLLAEKPFIRAAFEAEGSDFPIDSYLPGRHNFQNIKTAIAIGKYFKVPPAKIVRAIATYLPSNNRSQWLQQGTNSVLLDAYNANPTSMSHALQAFAGSPGERRVAILGEMLELGAESAAEHRKVLEYARSLPEIDQVLTVGAGFAEASRALAIPHFPDLLELQRWLEDHPVEGASVLLKASRGVGLERILPYL